MLKSANAPAGSPAGSAPARPLPVGDFWGSRRGLPRPADVVSDEQIRALVDAAGRLGRRQRERCVDAGTAAADERLRHLDWVVRAGRLALADRAAWTAWSTAGSAQRRWGHLWGRFHL